MHHFFYEKRAKRAGLLLPTVGMTLLFSGIVFSPAGLARGQDLGGESGSVTPSTDSTIPNATSNTSVQRTNGQNQNTQSANLTSAVVQFYDPSTTASVAPTSGTSGTSRAFQPVLSYAETVGRTVNPNAFLPSDSITDSSVVLLPPTRTRGAWDISASAVTGINYDSNITRSPAPNQRIGDFYEHNSVGANFRLGTITSPLAFHLAYSYSADTFDRYTGFDTYTHNLDFQMRIGRSNVVCIPYFIGSFRSVEDPDARDSGRESYNFLEEGAQGVDQFTPNLVHTYNFSHTSVDYGQRIGENFELWELDQELDLKPFERGVMPSVASTYQNVSLFPWLDLKQTAPTGNFPTVNEISGGIGGTVEINREISLRARVGYGGVESADPTIGEGQYSGWRYSAEAEYVPIRELHFRLSYERLLSFAPTSIGRSADVLDFVVESPLDLGAHFILTPSVEFYRSSSNDYLDPETSLFPQPSLQLNYQINNHVAAFMQAQYRDTEDDRFGFQSHIKVLQTSVGITATF